MVEYKDVVDRARAFHSSVFEVLGEQGWPGLFLWLWLHASGLWQMEKIRRRWRGREVDRAARVVPHPHDLQGRRCDCAATEARPVL